MRLLPLTLAPLLLAAAAYGSLLALAHPDEVAATRAWMAVARQQSAHRPPDVQPAPPSSGEEPTDASASLADPFQLGRGKPATTPASPPTGQTTSHGPDAAEDHDPDEGSAPAAHPASANAPARPALRLLGTLRRDQHWIALIELDGAMHRLQAGDALPGGHGEVLAVQEDQIDLQMEGRVQTVSMASYPAGATTTSARPASGGRLLPRSKRRILIRPGVRP